MSAALLERRSLPMEQTLAASASAGAEPGTIKGTACEYGVDVDRGYGLFMRLEPGCFAASVKDPGRVKILWQHDGWEPIGKMTELPDSGKRLDFAGRILDSPKVPVAQKALELLREDMIDETSVGFDIQTYTTQVDEEADTVTYVVSKAHLREVSIVTFGAMGRKAVVDEVHSSGGSRLAVLEARRIRAELARLRA